MKIKKITAMALACVMALGLAACGRHVQQHRHIRRFRCTRFQHRHGG